MALFSYILVYFVLLVLVMVLFVCYGVICVFSVI